MSLKPGVIVLAVSMLAGSSPALAQSSSHEEAMRKHRAAVERMQRQSNFRGEAPSRGLGGTASSHRGLPPVNPPDLTSGISPAGKAFMAKARADSAAREAARIKPRYTFDGGREFGYRFVLSLSRGRKTSYIAGYAAMKLKEKSAGSWTLLTRDNLQLTSSPDSLKAPAIGQLTSMLPRTMHVGDEGDEPDVDENLPAMLGNIEDWFFPPLPRSETEERAHGQTVIRQTDGEWSTVGFYNPNDRSAMGFYEWSIQPRGVSGGWLTVSDKRELRSEDGSIELIGDGSFTVDLGRGILQSRSFRGTLKEGASATLISLEITPAATSALDPK
ncbi:MAG: hypothetical protein L0211_23085 [Planctomycetaceae bacterium]|nr:hypothetical protein [Planctomycetaceae bacterium]